MAHKHQWVSTLMAFPHGGKDPNKTFCGICGVDKKDCEKSKGVGALCAIMQKIPSELFVPNDDYSDVEHNKIIEAGHFKIELKVLDGEITLSIGFTDDALSKMDIAPGCKVEMYRLESPINIDPNYYLSIVKGSFDQVDEKDDNCRRQENGH